MTHNETGPRMFQPEPSASAAPGAAPELTLADLLVPQWPRWSVSPRVRALVSTRNGGVSAPPFGRWRAGAHEGDAGEALPGGLNLGQLCGDDPAHVEANRARLLAFAGVRAAWLHQVHGARIVNAADVLEAARAHVGAPGVPDALDAPNVPGTPNAPGTLFNASNAPNVSSIPGAPNAPSTSSALAPPPQADASVTDQPGVACVVMVADCLPVLLCDGAGRAVGAAHAGWRGLAAGIVEQTARRVAALAGCAPDALHAYLGPSIGPRAFEVGEDVRAAFADDASLADPAQRRAVAAAFVAHTHTPGKYFADLPALARLRLRAAGITRISGGDACTVTERARFYSYRRDRTTGRMAAMIWLAA